MKKSMALASIILLSLSVVAQAETIKNWGAPSTWTPPAARSTGGRAALVNYPPLPFTPVTPCRVIDTRSGSGFPAGYGPPSMAGGGTQRTFTITGQCGVPAGAQAVSFNFAVWFPTSRGDIRVFPAGAATPTVSTLNWEAGIVALANAAVAPLGAGGAITVQMDATAALTDMFVDINGYYSGTQATGGGTFFTITDNVYGIWGQTNATSGGYGVIGEANGGSNGIGTFGRGSGYGLFGTYTGSAIGVHGDSSTNTGVEGISATGIGVQGVSTSYNGVWAQSTNQDGLFASGGRDGAYITGARYGAVGASTGATGILFGIFGTAASTTSGSSGVYGQDRSGAPTGWDAFGTSGVTGTTQSNTAVLGVGMFGSSNPGRFVRVNSASPFTAGADACLSCGWGQAASFSGSVSVSANAVSGSPGNLNVAGTLSKGAGSFKIDHPLDPENMYLYHSFVESPDMMNVYNGMVELDSSGSAVVKLPAYFQSLNRDFRYQLTAVGSRQPGIYIDQEVENNEFVIAGGKAHGKVSWQVTGIRKDPFAVKYPIVAEVEKEPEAKGHYLHPDVYGKPGEKSATAYVHEAQARRETEKAQEK